MKLNSGKILPLLLPFLHRFTWGHNNKPCIVESGTREIRKFLTFFVHEFQIELLSGVAVTNGLWLTVLGY